MARRWNNVLPWGGKFCQRRQRKVLTYVPAFVRGRKWNNNDSMRPVPIPREIAWAFHRLVTDHHRMTPELYSMLLTWLDSGTDAEKRHAAHRLSLPDSIGYEMPAGYVAPSDPVRPPEFRVAIPPAFHLGWKNCLYATHSQNGCCGGALTCHWRREVIPLQACVDCLTQTLLAPSGSKA